MTIAEFKKLLKSAPDDMNLEDLLPKPEPEKILISQELPSELSPPDGRFPTIRHSVNLGDLVAAMGCVKKYYDITRRKCIVVQQINRIAHYYQGAVHPTLDEEGRAVTCNSVMFDMIKPLIDSQNYVQAFDKYSGQHIDIDFDVVRGKTFVNMPHGPIQGWIPIAFPDLSFDISKPWITVDGNCPAHIKGQVTGKVILNFTARYREAIDYFFLQPYAPDLIFSGTEKEHWDFCNQWNLNIPRLQITNFLDLAYALKEARFSMSNQSMLWNLAQAMGTKRILEMCRFADNCFPGIGEDSHAYFFQMGAEYNFRTMYNKTMNKQ